MKLPNKPTTTTPTTYIEPRLAVRTGAPVNVRLVAMSRDECNAAVAAMQRQHGHQVAFAQPRAGRSGEWIAYGRLFVEGGS